MTEESGFEILPIDAEGKRIDFYSLAQIKTVPMTNRLFKTYNFLWALEIKENDFFLSGGKPHLKKISGRNSLVTVLCESLADMRAVMISVGALVPEAIKDVILYHELRESFWRFVSKLSLEEAHNKARAEEEQYVKKYLSPTEQKILRTFAEEIKEWKPRPLLDGDFKSDKTDDRKKIK